MPCCNIIKQCAFRSCRPNGGVPQPRNLIRVSLHQVGTPRDYILRAHTNKHTVECKCILKVPTVALQRGPCIRTSSYTMAHRFPSIRIPWGAFPWLPTQLEDIGKGPGWEASDVQVQVAINTKLRMCACWEYTHVFCPVVVSKWLNLTTTSPNSEEPTLKILRNHAVTGMESQLAINCETNRRTERRERKQRN